MDGMRVVLPVFWPGTRSGSAQVSVAVPFDCQLVGLTLSGKGGTDTLTMGYNPPDGDETGIDEAIISWSVSMNSGYGKVLSYSEFQGSRHDGRSPFRMDAGGTVQITVSGATTQDVYVGLILVEG